MQSLSALFLMGYRVNDWSFSLLLSVLIRDVRYITVPLQTQSGSFFITDVSSTKACKVVRINKSVARLSDRI